jgi:DHA2 family multidrug resistance protein
MGLSRSVSYRKALAQLAGVIAQQAVVVSYVNAFWVMACVVGCLTPLVLLLRKPSAEEEAAAARAH